MTQFFPLSIIIGPLFMLFLAVSAFLIFNFCLSRAVLEVFELPFQGRLMIRNLPKKFLQFRWSGRSAKHSKTFFSKFLKVSETVILGENAVFWCVLDQELADNVVLHHPNKLFAAWPFWTRIHWKHFSPHTAVSLRWSWIDTKSSKA